MDDINREMVDYMERHGKTKAGELSELVGISISSIRYRLFQLMAHGVVDQERTRDRQVWFYVTEKEAASRANSKDGHTTIQNRRIDNVNVNSGQ
ncbi:MAG: winged helix-turn-helix domain-containing protein [Halobacteriota archaeon]